MAHGDFSFLVSSLLTGDVIEEVDLASFNWTEAINRPGSGDATARIEVATTTEDNFLSWANALWIVKGSQIIWGGIIGSVQPRADSRVLNVPIHGFMEYYRTQPIQGFGTDLWEWGIQWGVPGHAHKGGVSFLATDQFRIFKDLIMHVSRRDSLSDIRPDVVWDSLSGVTRDDTWWNYEYKMVAVACEQLADREDGFLWTTEFEYRGNDPAFQFRLRYPSTGVERPITFEYDANPDPTNLMSYDLGGATRPANSVIAIGEGEGASSKFARADALADPNGAFTAGRPRYYEVLSLNDIKVTATLQAHANKYKDRHEVPLQNARIVLTPNSEPHYMDFNLADTLWLRIDDHGVQVFKKFRVTTRQIVISKEADEIVTLDLEEEPA